MSESGQTVEPASRAEWRAWLSTRPAKDGGVWLVLHHKGKYAGLAYEDAIEEAVAFGLIDGKAKRMDEQRYRVWIAPRREGSGWSRSNKARVERLLASGQMTEAGMAVVQAAKADGSWTALDALLDVQIPADLGEALDANPAAAFHFRAFPLSSRQMILAWIASARRPETRRQRIEETVKLAAQNLRVFDQRQIKP